MKDLLMFLIISIVIFLAGDYYFEFVIARELFPQILVAVFTGLFTIIVICYIMYIVQMLKRVLKINQQPKNTEEK
jgi:Na+/phosphate symporter